MLGNFTKSGLHVDPKKLGMALKCHDGQKRASEAGLVALIQKLDLVDEQQAEILSPSKIKNHNQILVGEIKVRIP